MSDFDVWGPWVLGIPAIYWIVRFYVDLLRFVLRLFWRPRLAIPPQPPPRYGSPAAGSHGGMPVTYGPFPPPTEVFNGGNDGFS